MRVLDFGELYYRQVNCFVSNIIADRSPVVRINGIDKNAGFSVVYTALGSRFDIAQVAHEAFGFNEYYASDADSIESLPIAEAMRYVRGQAIKEGKVPSEYQSLVEKVRENKNLYGAVVWQEKGDKNAKTLYLPGPASQLDETQVAAFNKVSGGDFYATTEFNDCGFMQIQLALEEELEQTRGKLAGLIDRYETVVTDDQYVYDALKCLFPQADKIIFIDQYLISQGRKIKAKSVALQESSVLNRLYPLNKTNLEDLFENTDIRLPRRSSWDVTDSGIAGGLGFFAETSWRNMAAGRLEMLEELATEETVSLCSAEAFGLNRGKEKVKTVLESAAE